MCSEQTKCTGEFIDVHDRLRPHCEVLDLLRRVESSGCLKDYFNGGNASGRLLFQVFSSEFVSQLARFINDALSVVSMIGPVLEVMSGDGTLAEMLRPLLKRDVIATDAKSSGYRIEYPKWVRTMDALDAVETYSPSFVVACWEPYLCAAGLRIAERGLPLAWIGEKAMCGHPELFDIEHMRAGSPYAIGRHDSILRRDFRTDIYLFNVDRRTNA
jgi:hypothetical protein